MRRSSQFYRSTLIVCTLLASLAWLAGPAAAQQQKPNILFIMGDDIGWMQPREFRPITHQRAVVCMHRLHASC